MENIKNDMVEKSVLPGACSCMTLTSKSGRHYWFRTCDIETDLWKDGAHVVQYPAGEKITYGDGKEEISQYSFLGMTYNFIDTWILDGINEWGLTGGLLMLYEGTSVEKAEEGKQGYQGMELVTKLLSSCKDVEEVKEKAEEIQILDILFGEYKLPSTMHYFFVDSAGNEVILEAACKEQPGRIQIYEKEELLGIMTNSPSYPKQRDNLAWFLSQSPELRQGLEGKTMTMLMLDGRKIQANENVSHISCNGTFPASYSSYDRFIRLTVFKALNESGNLFGDEEMLAMGSNLMKTVQEPCSKGVFHYTKIEEDGSIKGQKDSYTQYLIMYDIEEKCFYIQPFTMVSWVKYEMTEVSEKKSYPVPLQSMAGILIGNLYG